MMETDKWLTLLYEEESIAHIHGWDFSHLDGRYAEQEASVWDYEALIRTRLRPDMRLLDVDTGGGEFLLKLGHPCSLMSVTENYPPNVALCHETLSPRGIDVRQADAAQHLPFPPASFDMVINRHGDLNAAELFRVLRPGGWFITQQVGAENDRELVQLLLGDLPLPFPQQYLSLQRDAFEKAGFEIHEADEAFGRIRMMDVGALVWFARIIAWEFPGFSVDACLPQLMEVQRLVDRQGYVDGRTHRFMMVCRKPDA